MKKIKIDAHAKINLSLDVLKRREDGYHELEMIMQQLSLKDIITIEERDLGFTLESNSREIPLDTSNLVYKAYAIIAKRFNINKGIHIYIEKNIPIAGGLAGGSTDAAAVLKGLNTLWKLNLNEEQLMDIGLKIGADVPYCIMGGTALAKGVGEKLTKLNSFSDRLILIANPGINISTAYVYNNLNLDKIADRPQTQAMLKHIEYGDTELVAKEMKNVLETVTIKENPVLSKIKDQMIMHGALGSLMSGSGPTIFGIFKDPVDMTKCEKNLKHSIKTVLSTKTV
ncbi:4-(cytidine 5'-diphospho)-2-C-methyl-D-erythritol kinase [Proteiniborus sp. MB09-C3]|uniref:4-(cytidine 5'-diphospho)-2-C-methyl-D-erythritol kinase n=1 Tax=Proteiniborus sp. MB09-C3 TaxID=3050072 RepID=UPI002553E00F|nr:4-(cytidine 5'-diphospho)-2-C-methyl-D-erythritol kinase [Proteiniborus sp. MB09-C3]WIV12277.1 4-(cytidine 5'-diphospho)-2-C-methyl-D-erythritol kinase [Proteiniborus sp. MB09-C3]